MAVLNLTLGKEVEGCPNITIPDDTDYASQGVFESAKFAFHNYGSGATISNTTFTFTNLTWGSLTIAAGPITINVGATGNIADVEAAYLSLVDMINTTTLGVQASLVNPVGTPFTNWYLNIYSYTPGNAGTSLAVTSSPSAIVPFLGLIQAATPLTARNMTLYAPDGTAVDLGAVKQVDQYTLGALTYDVGKVFTFDFCGDTITYTVDSDNSAECVAKGIASAINSATGASNLFNKYVTATNVNGVVTLTAKEAGIPLNITASYSGTGSATFANTTGAVSSMSLPSQTASNSVIYKAIEKGGLYTSVLTTVSGCDYNTDENDFYSWCFDIDGFECCFISLLSKKECCKNSKSVYDDAATIQNIIRAISVMKKNSYRESEIQHVVNLGHSICEPLKCKCGC